MTQLKLTIPESSPEAVAYLEGSLATLDRQHGNTTALDVLSWETMWRTLRKGAVNRQGADVSAIGSTWVGSFVGMRALRPFADRDIARIGGASSFIPAAWLSARVVQDMSIWTAPWLGDARIIFYWRDMLNDAGVDEQTAFISTAHMEETCKRLRARGYAAWAAATSGPMSDTLINLASWVWEAGGDFVTSDGRHTLFNQPEARAGIRDYFSLHRYLAPEHQALTEFGVHGAFAARQVAVMMTGPWALLEIKNQPNGAALLARLGAALPPGPPCVSGTSLVIWEHSPATHERAAIEVIRHLTSPEVQHAYCALSGELPVRVEVLADPPFATDPHLQVFGKALAQGRSLRTMPLSGTVEERLTAALADVWEDVLSSENPDLDGIIAYHLTPLAERLDVTLAS